MRGGSARGNREGSSPLTGNFKREFEDSGRGASLFAGALLWGSFLGIRKDMGKRAHRMDITGNSER